eukprot:1041779-Pleurochrysis_carterae.AAC.1
MTIRTGRAGVVNADKGREEREAVSNATSLAKVSSVCNAIPPFALMLRPCSRVSSAISGKKFERGGKIRGTYSTSLLR